MQLFLLVKQLEIGPLDPCEDVPIHEAHVVAGRIIAIIAKLRAGPAFRREMLAPGAVCKASPRINAQSREPVEIAIG